VPVDPFLGHWKAEQSSIESRTLSGQLLSRSNLKADTMTLDVTATTLTFTTRLSQVQVPYTRSGEVIALTGSPAVLQYARDLTPTSFTFNLVNTISSTTTQCVARDFHR
jgi:hypothetical protein